MTIQEWAQRYIDLGLSPIPVDPATKKPRDTGWQTKTYMSLNFNTGDSIGIKLGEGVIDIDLDSPTARAIAHYFLPPTIVFERASSPNAHWIYSIKGRQKRLTWTGADKGMLVELRGWHDDADTPGMTVFPPSTHKSGEAITWVGIPDPLSLPKPFEVELDFIIRCCQLLVVAAIFIESSPGPGSRHDYRLAMCGAMHKAGLDDADIMRVGKIVTKVTGGDEQDWQTVGRSTLQKLKNNLNARVSGFAKLRELTNDAVVRALNVALGRQDQAAKDDIIDGFNAVHFFVRMGNNAVIGREDDPDSIVFQKTRDLQVEYANQRLPDTVVGRKTIKGQPAFSYWLESPERRAYKKVVFAPPPLVAREGEYNLWKDFAVKPDQNAWLAGAALPMMWHIRHVICDNDPDRYEYLMNLLARTVAHPGEPLGISIVMRGEQGGGKGVFVEFIGALFHRHHFSHLTKMDQAIGRFNKAILGKIILFLDEAAAEDAMRNHGTFKSLITDKTIQIELKGIDGDSVDNLAHIFIATNNERSVPTDEGDRRFFFLKVSDRFAFERCPAAVRKAYFDQLHAAVKDPAALGAFLYFLQCRNISNFDRFDKVITGEELHQRRQSLRGSLRWLYHLLAVGEIHPNQGWLGGDEVYVNAYYQHYEDWSRKQGEAIADPGPWGKVIAKYLWEDGKSWHTTEAGKSHRKAKLVSLEELAKRLPPLADFQVEKITLIRKYLHRPGLFEEEVLINEGDDD
jgi:hypothetical protein